jgi:hypothetical protein
LLTVSEDHRVGLPKNASHLGRTADVAPDKGNTILEAFDKPLLVHPKRRRRDGAERCYRVVRLALGHRK